MPSSQRATEDKQKHVFSGIGPQDSISIPL